MTKETLKMTKETLFENNTWKLSNDGTLENKKTRMDYEGPFDTKLDWFTDINADNLSEVLKKNEGLFLRELQKEKACPICGFALSWASNWESAGGCAKERKYDALINDYRRLIKEVGGEKVPDTSWITEENFPNFTVREEMVILVENGLDEGLDLEELGRVMNADQLYQIRKALEHEVPVEDVLIFASPDLHWSVMEEARLAFEHGLTAEDVRSLLSEEWAPRIPVLRRMIENEANQKQLEAVREVKTDKLFYLDKGLQHGLSPEIAAILCDDCYSARQVQELSIAYCDHDLTKVMVKSLMDKNLTPARMSQAIMAFRRGISVRLVTEHILRAETDAAASANLLMLIRRR